MGEEKTYSLKLTAKEIDILVSALIVAEDAANERSMRFAKYAENCEDYHTAVSRQKTAVRYCEKAGAYMEVRDLIRDQRLSQEIRGSEGDS